jgi:uncharacterized protein YcaQ
MPVVHGDKFIARVDAKADRAANTFRVINIFWENGIKINSNIKKLFEEQVKKLAMFSGCEQVVFK